MTPTLTPPSPPLAEPAPRFTTLLRALAPLAGLAVVFVFFGILRPHTFLRPDNLRVMVLQTAVVATAAIGMSLVIVSGGIDLSVGATIGLSVVIIAVLLTHNVPPALAAAGGVATGAVCGLLIGGLLVELDIPSFIVTLGTLGIFRGLAEAISGETTIQVQTTWLDGLLGRLPDNHRWMIFPPGVWMTIFLALVIVGMLRFTRFGRHIFAVGSNEQTARLCGVNVKRAKILIYILATAITGLAGVLQFSYLRVGDPETATGYELNIIAAVVIGGASLNGGEGSILGSVIGALLMTVIGNGCTKMGMPNPYQKIVTGVIIILAVAIDRLQHRRKT